MAQHPATDFPSESLESVASLSALKNCVDVWTLPPVDDPDSIADYARMLSDDERQRAARFHFLNDRHAFISNRGRLRRVLARYTGRYPQDLRFTYGPQGKPVLADSDVDFNLSHTEGLAVIALSQGRPLGIDVEKNRATGDLLEIARQQFAPAEYQELHSLDQSGQEQAFYRCWTSKEAFLKGLGDGLERDLRAFRVALLPGLPAELLSCTWEAGLIQEWHLQWLPLGPGYTGTLAYRGIVPPDKVVIQVRNLA